MFVSAKQLVLVFVLVIALSACAQEGTLVPVEFSEPQEEYYTLTVAGEPETLVLETPSLTQDEPHFRIIHAEPEENAEHHLFHWAVPLHLWSAIYTENIAVEYSTNLYFDEEGKLWVDSPAWTTLLVRKNNRIYPLHSLGANNFVVPIRIAQCPESGFYTIWAIGSTRGDDRLRFYEYNYDPELDAFIETKMRDDFDTIPSPQHRFNAEINRSHDVPEMFW